MKQLKNFLTLPTSKKVEIIHDWRYRWHAILSALLDKEDRRLRLSKEYNFTNRKNDHSALLMIVAGYQEHYWEVLLERVFKVLTPLSGIDVCVVCPGVENEYLCQICRNYGWSMLVTKSNKIALAQNIAIKIHEKAEWIYKIDEDIVIPENFFTSLCDTYLQVEETGRNKVGFVAPLINVNGYSYIYFLAAVGQLGCYEQKFEEAKSLCMGIKAHYDPEAATFILKHSLPFDKVAEKIYQKYKGDFLICPHRFSIGAIFFSRKIWEEMGMFKVAKNGVLGLEEQQICNYCMDVSHAIIVSQECLVAHLGFGPQKKEVMEFFMENKSGFVYNA